MRGCAVRSRAWLTERPFAHRGLHGHGRIENSRAAFTAAMAAGFGIECDVQASREGVPFVFHDARLERLTGDTGLVARQSAARLSTLRLMGSDEAIPSLADMLALVNGAVPLLIEIKAQRCHGARLCRTIARALGRYAGPVAVMSFDAALIGWFARHRPATARGLVASVAPASAAWRTARPHFVAVDVRRLPKVATRARTLRRPVLSWTVRSADDRARAAAHADQIIFEDATA
jgi:glycerophosphoryl diester phosphodiesterase